MSSIESLLILKEPIHENLYHLEENHKEKIMKPHKETIYKEETIYNSAKEIHPCWLGHYPRMGRARTLHKTLIQ